jgi:putative FmdB family regulatory protein
MAFHQYNFRCRDCGAEFEIDCTFEAIVGLDVNCPECYSESTHRVFSVPNIKFDGRGFYSTDNKKKKDNKQ